MPATLCMQSRAWPAPTGRQVARYISNSTLTIIQAKSDSSISAIATSDHPTIFAAKHLWLRLTANNNAMMIRSR